jgi:hypothetical protein
MHKPIIGKVTAPRNPLLDSQEANNQGALSREREANNGFHTSLLERVSIYGLEQQ